ncbi:MAG: LD-carboxypeptidase [Saprospiraceae bacterium]
MDRRYFNKLLPSTTLLASGMIGVNTSDTFFSRHKIIKPQKLMPGDKVALVAPGSPVKPERFENAIKNLESLQLIPVHTERVYLKHGFLAGTDAERLADLHQHFKDEEVKAIWALRGGYGCTRLLPYLDYRLIKKNPKILLGYSDITALLLAINAKTGLVGYHGPVASSNVLSSYSMEQMKQILFGRDTDHHIITYQKQSDSSNDDIPYVINSGKASGQLIGGNLSLLVNLPNTVYAPSYKNKIVFLEDVGEKPYRIDRMLTFLLQATDLAEANGIILGVFSDCNATSEESSLTLKETLIDRLGHLNMPCFYGFTFGHVTDICTFPIGLHAEFDTESMQVTLLEKSVSE